jgi:hypothetical protein
MRFFKIGKILAALAVLLIVSSCGGESETQTPIGAPEIPEVPETPEIPVEPEVPIDPESPECSGEVYGSTFEAVQKVIFDRYQCVACHSGDSPSGELDLSPEVSYQNLIEVSSVGSNLDRVYPGSRERSSLWLKMYGHVDPSVTSLALMPPSGPIPTDEEFELLRLWLIGGAPDTGVVLGTEELLPGCLSEPTPQSILPLEAPEPTEGVQFEMPGFDLYAASEREVCFATYYDFTDDVPEEYQSEDGKVFYFDGWEVRQDALSHHLIVFLPVPEVGEVTPDDFSDWSCGGGERAGEPCDPLDKEVCGRGGFCRTPVEDSLACNSYAPVLTQQSLAVQQAQSTQEFYPGTYREWPLRGIMLWNSHSFNITAVDHILRGRFNLRFARDRQYPQLEAGGFDTLFGIPRLLFEGTAPYTEQVLCERAILPEGARVTGISSHTHRLGKHFWYEMPDGTHIYDSYIYNDPLNLFFEEPMSFDSPDPAERTLTYCSLFRNGVDEDGNPVPEEVTRASEIGYPVPFAPGSNIGLCEPTHCVNEGMYDVECDDGIANTTGDDAACDSSPGAGDGICDACPITGGITTGNEMFGAQIWYFMSEGYPNVPVEFPDSIFIPGIIGGPS